MEYLSEDIKELLSGVTITFDQTFIDILREFNLKEKPTQEQVAILQMLLKIASAGVMSKYIDSHDKYMAELSDITKRAMGTE